MEMFNTPAHYYNINLNRWICKKLQGGYFFGTL